MTREMRYPASFLTRALFQVGVKIRGALGLYSEHNVSRIAGSRLSRFLVNAASPLLVAYVILLLATTYVSQEGLRDAADKELHLELEKQAAALSYFFSERQSDLEALRKNRSLAVYFSNRALGMSMEYGLRASMLTMHQRFEELVDSERVASIPVYRRLMFVDGRGEVLVDVGSASGEPAPGIDGALEYADPTEVQLFFGAEKGSLLVLAPYIYREAVFGAIIAEVDRSLIFDNFLHSGHEVNQRLSILAEPASLGDVRTDESTAGRGAVAVSVTAGQEQPYFRIPIHGTHLNLVVSGSNESTGGYLASRWYLVSLSMLAVLILVSVAMGVQVRSRNLALNVRFEESKRQKEQLSYLAHHDPLTNLPNRLLMTDRLEQSVEYARASSSVFAVVFVDLDGFKNINDSLGHQVGDELLRQMSKRLSNAIRSRDTLARISGDEFVLLLEGVGDESTASVVIEKLTGAFSMPFRLAGREIRVTASMGISLYPRDGGDAETLLRNADSAMYRAKQDGRNTHQFYTEELTRAAFERGMIENALRGALDRQELHLVYQPQVDLSTGRVTCIEALLRWQSPEFGVVSPATFIPLLEQNGLINEIGAWVLRTACEQAVWWLDSGLEFKCVAVNVSGNQLQRSDFAKEVQGILEGTQLSPERLELEVTEGSIMQNIDRAIAQISFLQDLGVSLAIDDFGTGYSSMSYLKRLPLSKLKIDLSFVRDIPFDKDDMAISEAIISLGKSFGLTVVAEGVETQQQATFLTEKGCDQAQGYFFAEPLRAPQMSLASCRLKSMEAMPPRWRGGSRLGG